MFLKDSNGEKSLTATAFIFGFIVVNFKFLMSGLTVKGFAFSAFTGAEYGMALGALGAIYVLRRSMGNKTD